MAVSAHYCRLPTITAWALLFLMFWLSYLGPCEAKPQWARETLVPPKTFIEGGRCETDSEVDDICQRCAKATKSVNAYPMCCLDYDGAINWCTDYVYFGIQ